MKEFEESDKLSALTVECFYTYEQFRELVDDFIFYLQSAEIWQDEKLIPSKNLCLAFRVYFRQEITTSIKDNKVVFPGVGLEFMGIGRINENHEMAVSSTTNLERGECRRDSN